jgi:hypothetical protein
VYPLVSARLTGQVDQQGLPSPQPGEDKIDGAHTKGTWSRLLVAFFVAVIFVCGPTLWPSTPFCKRR